MIVVRTGAGVELTTSGEVARRWSAWLWPRTLRHWVLSIALAQLVWIVLAALGVIL